MEFRNVVKIESEALERTTNKAVMEIEDVNDKHVHVMVM